MMPIESAELNPGGRVEQQGDIQLAQTGLCIRDGCLVKQTSKGQVIARHAISDIEQAGLGRKWDPVGFVFVPTFVALAVVAWLYIPWAGLRWTTAILLWGVAGILLTGIRDTTLRLRTRHGWIEYVIKDDTDDAGGFAVTLLDLIEQHNSAAVAHDRQPAAK